jgi:CDP-diacylglycerol--glycerol-3-phosphate 3-phosphatidyltransferase
MPPQAAQTTTEQRLLRFRFLIFGLIGGLVLVASYRLLTLQWQQALASQWASVAALLLAYQMVRLWPDLNLNRRNIGSPQLPSFGWGTILSLLRLLCIALLAGFLTLPPPPVWLAWAPAVLNLIANFTDYLDGYAARISNQVTLLGQKLDMDLDGRGLLVVSLLAYQYGQVPWWFLLVGMARYLFLAGLWWRERHGRPVYELEPSKARRAFAGVQMGFTTAMLVPIFSPPETTLAAGLFILPFLGNFLADWWQISGARELRARWDAFWQKVWVIGASWGALFFRCALVGLLAVRLTSSPAAVHFLFIEAASALFIALGLVGRITAVIVLLETGFRLASFPTGFNAIIILLGTATLFLGTGPYSLWRPEDHWIQYRAGEKLRPR